MPIWRVIEGSSCAFLPAWSLEPSTWARIRAPLWVILALPFCISLFHSTRRQKIVSWVFIGALILLIWWVRTLPQPWRGIIDGGVVLGLLWGLGVIWWLFVRYLIGAEIPPPGDLPAEKAVPEQPVLV